VKKRALVALFCRNGMTQYVIEDLLTAYHRVSLTALSMSDIFSWTPGGARYRCQKEPLLILTNSTPDKWGQDIGACLVRFSEHYVNIFGAEGVDREEPPVSSKRCAICSALLGGEEPGQGGRGTLRV
jgi:hypothetical protein